MKRVAACGGQRTSTETASTYRTGLATRLLPREYHAVPSATVRFCHWLTIGALKMAHSQPENKIAAATPIRSTGVEVRLNVKPASAGREKSSPDRNIAKAPVNVSARKSSQPTQTRMSVLARVTSCESGNRTIA